MKLRNSVIVFILLFLQTVLLAQQTSTEYFTGDGGSGMRLGILEPKSQNLRTEQNYLPSMVQGVLVSTIRKYSAIEVLDTQALDQTIREMLGGTYQDDLDLLSLGQVVNVGYMLTGRLIRTSSGYTMQLNVTDTTPNARTIASYSGNCTVEQLDTHIAIQIAAQEILTQMGVQLTDRAKRELGMRATPEAITAQTSLAQGIAATRRGQEVEGFSHIVLAATLDPSLLEAVSRANITSAQISSGGIGETTRNLIELRRVWMARLKETEEIIHKMLTDNPPFTLYYCTYIHSERIDYQKETVDVSHDVNIQLNKAIMTSIETVAQTVYNGLQATSLAGEWGLSNWPTSPQTNVSPFNKDWKYDFNVAFELINDKHKTIGKVNLNTSRSIRVGFANRRFMTTGTENSFYTLRYNEIPANDYSDKERIQIARVNGATPDKAKFSIIDVSRERFNEFRPPNRSTFARFTTQSATTQAPKVKKDRSYKTKIFAGYEFAVNNEKYDYADISGYNVGASYTFGEDIFKFELGGKYIQHTFETYYFNGETTKTRDVDMNYIDIFAKFGWEMSIIDEFKCMPFIGVAANSFLSEGDAGYKVMGGVTLSYKMFMIGYEYNFVQREDSRYQDSSYITRSSATSLGIRF